VRAGAVVTGTSGTDRITHAMVADFDGVKVGAAVAVSCDTLMLSGGWNPAVHLFSQARGTLRYDPALGGFVPASSWTGSASPVRPTASWTSPVACATAGIPPRQR